MGQRKRILVVDDEEMNLLLLTAMLKSLGYEPEQATSGPEALSKLSADIDLILLDVMMPGMDGFEVLSLIRDDPAYFDIPVIMVTILSGTEHRLHAVETGANDFITKPVSKLELRVRMESLLKMKQAQDQIKASLKEKEMLLNEIHHRVKNNLATVASMLRMQARHMEIPEAKSVIEDVARRASAMGLIHERLYTSPDLSSVNAKDYLEGLVGELFKLHGTLGRRITLKTNIESMIVQPDTAVPMGQMVSELFSNCLKHAFKYNGSGIVEISLVKSADDFCDLIVRDNGTGITTDVNIECPNTLGLRLVNSLASQLNGSMEIFTDQGTNIRVRFRNPTTQKT